MLNEKEYKDLWNDHFDEIVSKKTKMPPYNEYVIRENMFQDYLDIFRGKNTRNDKTIRPIVPKAWYYEHPFFKNDGKTRFLEEKQFIQYILIGESAPKKKEKKLDEEKNAVENLTYIYNTKLKGGQYITSILNAFGNNLPVDTIERLVEMAKYGVVLIDMFPFAIKYESTFREELNKEKTTNSFFEYCIDRIKKLPGQIEPRSAYKSAFVTPPTICNHLAKIIEIKGIKVENDILDLDITKNELGPTTISEHNLTKTIKISLNNEYDVAGQKKIPTYRCCCYSGAKTVPHEIFIKNALHLQLKKI